LLDSITHEFRTPLTAIKLSVTTLLSPDPVKPEANRELLTVINEETDRLNRLVGEAAEMARLEAHQVELRRERYPVRDVIAAALDRSKQILGGREIRLHIPDDLPEVQVDRDRIGEVLAQLLENAAKYSTPGTPITITADPADTMVRISVADQGPGIDDMEQHLIFEKFYRGRDQRYSVQGTGMGLAIAKAIVEAHQGTMAVVAQLGDGSVFQFTVPAEPKPQTAST
jgi:two-component system sensor histidine kinase KdpD